MAGRKSYGQFCGLARALDHVGDRWALLVVRELLLEPRTFRQLRAGLAGVSPTLLADRIGGLVTDGLVERNDAPARSKAVTYRLTPAGAALEPALFELIRWGARWMVAGPGPDRVDPAWAALALRALLDGTPTPARSRRVVHLDLGGEWVTVRLDGRRRAALGGRHGTAHATVTTAMADALHLAAGLVPLADIPAQIDGDPAVAEAALVPDPDYAVAR